MKPTSGPLVFSSNILHTTSISFFERLPRKMANEVPTNLIGEPKFVSIDVRNMMPASEFEFRFFFLKAESKARAIRIDEVTLDIDVADQRGM